MITASPAPHSTRKVHSWQEVTGITVLLFLLTLVYFWPQVGRGRVLYWGDVGLYFTPMTQFLHDNLRAGRLPLWNPLILCGAPFVGNPQTWPLYPLTALLPAVSAPTFLSLTVAVHVWLAGVGTALFLRRTLAVSTGPALLGAISFMFGGWLVSKEQFPNMVQAAAYLPWVLWGLDRLLCVRRIGAALTFGVVLGLQLLAAHAQMTLLTLYLAAGWGVFVLRQRRTFSPARLVGRLALAGLVAAGLAAGQILPTLQIFHDGWRQNLSFPIVNRFYLPLNQTANWVLPALHGQPYFGNFTARGNFWETCCDVGWLPFLAALAGGILCWRRGGDLRIRFWAVAFVFAFLMALGGGAGHAHGLYWVAYKILPGFHSFHDPARCLFWATFALSALAASGAQALLHRLTTPGARWGAAGGLCLVSFASLAAFGRTIYPLADPATLFPATPAIAALRSDPAFAAHQARFLAPDSARVWQRFSGHRAYRQGVPHYQALWADTLTPNLMMSYGLPDAYGYEPVTRRDTQQVLGAIMSVFRPDAPAAERARATEWAGILGVRAITTDRVRPPGTSLPGLTPLLSDAALPSLYHRGDPSRTVLSRNTHFQPRARLTSDFVNATARETGLARVMDALKHPERKRLDLGHTVVVAGPVPFLPAAGPASDASLTEDEPDRVAVTAAPERPSLLVLADTLHPGWQATVDGRPATLLSADGCLRAVPLPQPGTHQVVFTYRPATFLLGLYLTLLTLSGLIGTTVAGRAGKSKKESPPVPSKTVPEIV